MARVSKWRDAIRLVLTEDVQVARDNGKLTQYLYTEVSYNSNGGVVRQDNSLIITEGN